MLSTPWSSGQFSNGEGTGSQAERDLKVRLFLQLPKGAIFVIKIGIYAPKMEYSPKDKIDTFNSH
jgi:hypothetical protein